MKRIHLMLFVLIAIAGAKTVVGQTHTSWVRGKPTQITTAEWKEIGNHIDVQQAKIDNSEGAEKIICTLLNLNGSKDGKPAVCLKNSENKGRKNDDKIAVIIHVARWETTDKGEAKITKDNWYVYHQGIRPWSKEDFAERKRLFGVRTVTLMYLHLNKPDEKSYEAFYELTSKKKTPAYLNRLLSLIGLFKIPGGVAGAASAVGPPHFYGAGEADLKYAVSDVTIEPKLISCASPAPCDGKEEKIGNSITFDNEGKYFLDFSVGIPIRRIKQLDFNLTNTTAAPKDVDKQNVFALINLHPRPIDIKSTGFNYVPHFVGGVAIAKQPMHKILAGAGWGPVFANFYFGALFVKQAKPVPAGQTATKMEFEYKPQFAFGINLPVGAAIEKLKPKK